MFASGHGRVPFAHALQGRLVRLSSQVLDFDGQAGRLQHVSFTATVTCLFVLQQLQVAPLPARVGDELTVRATRGVEPVAGVVVEVELPDGSRNVLGETGAGGGLVFRPSLSGDHAFFAEVDGVRCIAPVGVGPEWRGVWLALGSVPLGLALLWVQLRAWRARREEPPSEARAEARVTDQASTRST